MDWLPFALKLEVGQFSHPGQKRQNNEDWLGTFQPCDAEQLADKGSLFLVADGMGGHQSGELASRWAVDQVIRGYMDTPGGEVASSLRLAVEAANAALYARAKDEQTGKRRWGTTLVAAVVRGDKLWIANVGDSRAYLMRDGKIRQLSKDHSLAAEVGPGPAGQQVGLHVITRALGLKANIDVDIFPPLTLKTEDRVLLCSDGLTTPLSDGMICEIAGRRTAQKATEELVRQANSQGGPDNISVILIRVAARKVVFGWRTVSYYLSSLTQPETWRIVSDLPQAISSGKRGWSPPMAIGALLVVILAFLCFGFTLGLVIFGSLK